MVKCQRAVTSDGIPYREVHVLDFLGRDIRNQAIVRIAGNPPECCVVHHPGMAVLISAKIEFDTMETVLERIGGG